MYSLFTGTFHNVLNKHAPVKQMKKRGSHAQFMSKDLSKAIWINQKQGTSILNGRQEKMSQLWRVKKASVTIELKVTKKSYFQKVTQTGFANNKSFWNTIKPFLTNKGILISNSISLTQENVTVKYNSFSIGTKIATVDLLTKKLIEINLKIIDL